MRETPGHHILQKIHQKNSVSRSIRYHTAFVWEVLGLQLVVRLWSDSNVYHLNSLIMFD